VADVKALLRHMEEVQREVAQLYEQVSEWSGQVRELVEENRRLSLENAHLREQLQMPRAEGGLPEGEAARFLREIYEEGFHVCNISYGSFRKGECLFCLESLQRIPSHD
jgi:regulator of replication initiation timing